jgi:hypothetical protein
MNHLASAALGWKPPMEVLTGQTPDISKFLHFSFFEPVYYHAYTDTFPSASNKEKGWWVGIATHVGDALTYKILTKHHKAINRSAIRSALDPAKRNQRLSPIGRETEANYLGVKMFIRSNFDPTMKRQITPDTQKDNWMTAIQLSNGAGLQSTQKI